MLANDAQLIAAYGGIVGGAGGVTAAVFTGLTWWRGRQRAAPDLTLAARHRWPDGLSHDPAPDGYGSSRSRAAPLALTNLGDAHAHAVQIDVVGGIPMAPSSRAPMTPLPNPTPMLARGDTVEVNVLLKQPIETVTVTVTWGQPPKVTRRQGPRTWRLLELAPPDWRPPDP